MSWLPSLVFLVFLKTITIVQNQFPDDDVDLKYFNTTKLSPPKYLDVAQKNVSSVNSDLTMSMVITEKKSIPLTSMIQLHMTGGENDSMDNLYTEKTFKFTCSVIKPLGFLNWQLQLKDNKTNICIDSSLNGTRFCPNYSYNEFVNLTDVNEDISEGNGTEGGRYNNRTSLITFHNANISKLICNVPLLVIWVSLETNITVTDSVKPKIVIEDANYEIDEKGGYITCKTTGFPPPIISWSKNGKNITPEIAISSDGGTLTFPTFNNKLEGDYECSAENFMGHDTFTFRVKMKRNNDSNDNSLEIKLIISITVSVAVLTTVLLILYCRYRLAKRALAKLTKEEIDEFFNGVPIGGIEDEEEKNIINIPYNIKYEIAKEKMKINKDQILGFGQFGQVFKGHIDGIAEIVAFKTTKPDCPLEMFKALLLELKTMGFIGAHANIVRLIGACTSQIRDGVLYIAMEFCKLGSLEDFFETNRIHYCHSKQFFETDNYQNCYHSGRFAFQFKNLVVWSQEIATGMEFLAEKKVIHSDLATRNVLLDSNRTAKITDFGLSRRLYQYTNYVKMGEEPLPWRWMAIESIKFNTFSTKSDVWSFGITLWEIFSLGSLPYPGLSWSLEFGNQLESGLRNAQPNHATIEIYEIMKNCWLSNPEERPTFSELKKGLIEFEKYYCS